MEKYQREFIEFALAQGALRFGDFTLKSGRRSPYFFNTGAINTGAHLWKLGEYYAAAANTIEFDMLFGPAYKGIPLATAAAIAMASNYNRNLPLAFNRKELKDHGEGGMLIGAPLTGKVLIIDDVISAGTSALASLKLIKDAGAEPAGILVALDRQERDSTAPLLATLPTFSVVRLEHLIQYLEEQDQQDSKALEAMKSYWQQYAATPPQEETYCCGNGCCL